VDERSGFAGTAHKTEWKETDKTLRRTATCATVLARILVAVSMRPFILHQNLVRFRMLLAEEADEARQRTLRQLICAAQRELASLDATSSGLLLPGRASVNKDRQAISTFQRCFEASRCPYLVLDPGPGLHVVDINDSYAHATMISRSGVVGERLFNVFPENPKDPYADGLSKVYASLQIAAETGRPHDMSVQRYDIRDAQGKFVERDWYTVNTPLLDQEGHLIYLLIYAEDVTADFQREQPPD
jgi:hypothetical protein